MCGWWRGRKGRSSTAEGGRRDTGRTRSCPLRLELAATLASERSLREVEIATQLSHPHVLPMYDSGGADGLTT